MNISKFADKLMNDEYELTEKEERLINIYNNIYGNPYRTVGDIRDAFDDSSFEELKYLFNNILYAPHDNYDEMENGNFGDRTYISIPINAQWNAQASTSLWKMLKNEKKTFF